MSFLECPKVQGAITPAPDGAAKRSLPVLEVDHIDLVFVYSLTAMQIVRVVLHTDWELVAEPEHIWKREPVKNEISFED